MNSVSITAQGVITAWGAGEESLWQGLLTGQTCIIPCPQLAMDGALAKAARVPDAILSRWTGLDRTVALACAAADQIQKSPAWSSVNPRRLGICIGTTQGSILTWQDHQRRMRFDSQHRPPPPRLTDPALTVAQTLGAEGPLSCPSMACTTGAAAVALGVSWIRCGLCEAVIAGGVDALSTFVQAGFSVLRALDPELPRPFDRDRAGLGLGEGAALVLLQPGHGAGCSEIAGWGLSSDAHHLTGPDPTGSGLARAIRAALQDAALETTAVEVINAHGTATVFNDLMEAKAFEQVFGQQGRTIPVNSIKGAIGHTMAAAGAIEIVLCAQILSQGLVPPTTNLVAQDPEISLDIVQRVPREGPFQVALSTSAGFGGLNAACILKKNS